MSFASILRDLLACLVCSIRASFSLLSPTHVSFFLWMSHLCRDNSFAFCTIVAIQLFQVSAAEPYQIMRHPKLLDKTAVYIKTFIWNVPNPLKICFFFPSINITGVVHHLGCKTTHELHQTCSRNEIWIESRTMVDQLPSLLQMLYVDLYLLQVRGVQPSNIILCLCSTKLLLVWLYVVLFCVYETHLFVCLFLFVNVCTRCVSSYKLISWVVWVWRGFCVEEVCSYW